MIRICKGCKAHEPLEQLITYSSCEASYHRIKCATPAVYDPTDDWFCGACGGAADFTPAEKKAVDITIVQDTLDYMRHGMHDAWDRKTKVRVAARAKQHVFKAGKLYKPADGKFPTDSLSLLCMSVCT